MDSDPLSPRWDGSRQSSSSFPRGWSRLPPSYALGVAGPSNYPNWPYETATEELDRLSLQPRRDPQPRDFPASAILAHQQSTDRHTPPPAATGPSSTANTQPVLVRAYSGNADSTTAKPSTMSSTRRLFPFKGSKNSASSRPSGPPLPSDKEFSIENILQAIEPDIQDTLDSIAEICGRSKLSLANEYGSHIAPLGEIRAPASGLVPVEEAASTDERQADEGVVIFDDDPNIMDPERDMHPFSFYRYLENLRQASSALEGNGTGPRPIQSQPNVMNDISNIAPESGDGSQPTTREFVTKPKNTSRNFLAKQVATQIDPSQDIVTPAVVSEVHLDAQFEGKANSIKTNTSPAMGLSAHGVSGQTWQAPELLRSLIGWLKWAARVAGPESEPALQSAEDRLRAMLERNANDNL